MRDGYRWQQPAPEAVRAIRNRRQYRQHVAEIRAAQARAKCRKEHGTWGVLPKTATEVSGFCCCLSPEECRCGSQPDLSAQTGLSGMGEANVQRDAGQSTVGAVVPPRELDAGLAVAGSHPCPTQAASPEAIAVVSQDALFAGVEARLTEEMWRLIGALRQFAAVTQGVSKELDTPATKVLKNVPVSLGLFSMQVAHLILKFSDTPLSLLKSGLDAESLIGKLDESLLEVKFEGKKFLAVALPDSSLGEAEKDVR